MAVHEVAKGRARLSSRPLTLPPQVSEAVQPLFDALALDHAMAQVVVRARADQVVLKIARGLMAHPLVSKKPELMAGIWLYVDELEPSHKLCQAIASQTGSFLHAIVHRREGDFGNALYWYRRAGAHPAMDRIPGYDPERLVELAESGDPSTVSRQRAEWASVFEWCAFNS